jgi:hypothetical protein
MHIRRFDVAKDVPIGKIPVGISETPLNGPFDGQTFGVDVPDEERQTFDLWLRNRWAEKDQLMQRFHDTGTFSSFLDEHPEIIIPLQLNHMYEILNVFWIFFPAIVGYVWTQLRRIV